MTVRPRIYTQASTFWKRELQLFHTSMVPLDGMWLDMDEIESFCDGRCTLDVQVEESLFNSDANSLYTCVCPAQYDDPLDDPPYLPGGGKPPGKCCVHERMLRT